MAFQAAVATWLAAHILARAPVGGRFGINNLALPVSIRLETGADLDDIEVTLSDGGSIHIQCKTSASLSDKPDAALVNTIRQLVQWVSDASPDPTRSAAALAVRSAPKTLQALESGCRAFDLGGDWTVTKPQRNQAEREALAIFETTARSAWHARRGPDLSGMELAALARVFHLSCFSMDAGEHDWREASQLLGRQVFGGELAGDAPLRDLVHIMRGLIGSGAPADRAGLLRELAKKGHQDVGAPRFEQDVAKLRTRTTQELARLSKYTQLPLGAGVRLTRTTDVPLAQTIALGSVLVVGDPGAGKTGAMVQAAEAIKAAGGVVIALGVDRFPSVTGVADLTSELGLQHPLLEVLAAMPGAGSKVLFVDALDAARGGPAEGVFATLIEDVRRDLPEWTVVASMRTFDLKNGRRFREAFGGTPVAAGHIDPSLPAVRHFVVPLLSDEDLTNVGTAAPELAALLATAPLKLRSLLKNIFNLSLAAQLLSDGAEASSFGAIRSQAGLIEAYEDRRLAPTALKQAVAKAASTMTSRRRLTVRKVLIDSPDLDAAIQTGVLVENGDLVSFAHHVLFDHITGRLVLEWDEPTRLIQQLKGETSTALLLAPALRFAIERMWRDDGAQRPRSWQLLGEIFAAEQVDPVLGHVALRVVVENIEVDADIVGLLERIKASPADPTLATLVALLVRFVGMEFAATPIPCGRAIVWARLADVLVAANERGLLDAARYLLHVLFEQGDLQDPELLKAFGAAARALLVAAWSPDPPLTGLSSIAIRFVGKSFAADPAASRLLLDRILHEPHFSQYADREAGWLAEQILPIARADPKFAAQIYGTLYGKRITDTSSTSLGGHHSRIMPITSNRQQDYDHCRWRLGTAMGQVLAISPFFGTRAVIEAAIGTARMDAYECNFAPQRVAIGAQELELFGRYIDFEAWDAQGDSRRNRDDDFHRHYVLFLRSCDAADFAKSVAAASLVYASVSVWTRIFGVGRERVAEVADILWPLLAGPGFLEISHTAPEAARFAALAWPSRSPEERMAFEHMVLDRGGFGEGNEDHYIWQDAVAGFLAAVGEDALALDDLRALRRSLVKDQNASPAGISTDTDLEGAGQEYVRQGPRQGGGDRHTGSNRTVHEASNVLYEHVQKASANSPGQELSALWQEALALIQQIDANPELDEQVRQQAWGHVSNAVEKIVASSSYAPGAPGLPPLEDVLPVLERLTTSVYPLPRERQGQGISWGNWDVRVYAASSWVRLASDFAAEHPVIIDRLDAFLGDPVAAVRLQVAQNLQVIRLANPDRMWKMAERVAADERDSEVLASLLFYSMRRIGGADPARCEALLTTVSQRVAGDLLCKDKRNLELADALGDWAAHLFVGEGRPLARSWLETWAADPQRHASMLHRFVSCLRGPLFDRYAVKALASQEAVCDRAQVCLNLILAQALAATEAAHSSLRSEPDEAAKAAAIECYRACAMLIDHAVNQLYFGSGAYNGQNADAAGLPNKEAQARFLDDYSDILAMFGRSREPSTLHHLIETYEFLIPANPTAVFEAVHQILLGRGRDEGYHFESLGSDAVVRIVRRYVADHRAIFDDDDRRARLVAILRLFSEAGWVDALRLLYDLPELLR